MRCFSNWRTVRVANVVSTKASERPSRGCCNWLGGRGCFGRATGGCLPGCRLRTGVRFMRSSRARFGTG